MIFMYNISHINGTLSHHCLYLACNLCFNLFTLIHYSIVQVIFICTVHGWSLVQISYMYTCISNFWKLLKADKQSKFNQIKLL